MWQWMYSAMKKYLPPSWLLDFCILSLKMFQIISFIKRKCCPNLPSLVWKSNYPLNLISSCPTLGSKNSNEALWYLSMTHLNPSGGILASSSQEHCFISGILEGFQVWTACLRSFQNISIWFGGGLTGVFRIIVLYNQRLNFRPRPKGQIFSFGIFL